VPGYMLVLGNDTSATAGPAGAVDLWRYNVIKNTWSNTYDYPGGWPSNPTGYPPQPFVFSSGGAVLAIDELSPNNVFALDTLAPNGAWKTFQVTPSSPIGTSSRWGQRFLSWGSSLFMYGGITTQAPQTFRQDLWALELTQVINNALGPTSLVPGWNLVSNTDPNTGVTAGFPDGRIGPSWTGYTIGALLFGGLATTDGSAPYPKCFKVSPSAPAPPECLFHHHVWAFLPGTTDWFVPVNGIAQKYDGNAWARLNDVGANGGPVPAGRTEHCAGNQGDQLYIYGGQTATGLVTPSDALWTYNLASQTWVNIPNQNPSPSIGYGGGGTFAVFATGTFIAHHFYAYVETYDGAPDFNHWVSGQLWRWAPNNAALPPGVAYPTPYNPSGHTAGIVIGILLGIANLYFLWLLVGNAGVDILPASLTAMLPTSLSCFGGGGAKPAGYYNSGGTPNPSSYAPAAYAPPSGPDL